MTLNTSFVGTASYPAFEGGAFRPGEAIRRVVNTSPEWAELALDHVPVSYLALPGASLQLRSMAGDGTTRRFVGVLASDRGWHRLAVELELDGWSTGKSELTLLLLGGTRRPGWGRWYLRTGRAFMDLLVAAARTPLSRPPMPDTSVESLSIPMMTPAV